MSTHMINIAQQSLAGFKTAAATAAKNIQFSSDPNFARESVRFSTGLGGQLVVASERMADAFLNQRLGDSRSALSYTTLYSTQASFTDKLVTGVVMDADGNYNNPLSYNTTEYLLSFERLMIDDNPSNRELVLNAMATMAYTFNSTSESLEAQIDVLNSQIGTEVQRTNQLMDQLARVNETILATPAGGQDPTLLNQRDALLAELSGLVDVQVRFYDNGTTRVELKNGMPLVDKDLVNHMSVGPGQFGNDPEIYVGNFQVSEYPNVLGGSLGAAVATREEVVEDTIRQLGLLALTLVNASNEINNNGYTSAGVNGPDLFAQMMGYGVAGSGNTGNAQINLTFAHADTQSLKADPMVLTRTPTGFEVRDANTGALLSSSAGLPVVVNGVTIDMPAGAANNGDEFYLDPMRDVAQQMTVVATADDIAAAANLPVVDGDNGNLLAFAGLKNQPIMGGGESTITEGFSIAFSEIGTKASGAQSRMTTAESILNSTLAEQQALSGVVLEEEQISLIQFEQLYQASSKIIQTSQGMFNSLLGVF
ncbi:flagellar hook-associated protein FlgK [Ferrimonas marina]|uniref:Flagellar hook-associated protein 1 n=1 Tax=Ferrimonas marina TaxID=299255 RepID=A0A1M5TD81_9GAMM|nr:flagellar basal body rod C-terminal domain-containing protein [Ferrimonas marina]SHH48775.1 flagellar hook-associated protein FlgK [Ferrimonas marina]